MQGRQADFEKGWPELAGHEQSPGISIPCYAICHRIKVTLPNFLNQLREIEHGDRSPISRIYQRNIPAHPNVRPNQAVDKLQLIEALKWTTRERHRNATSHRKCFRITEIQGRAAIGLDQIDAIAG